MKEERGKWEEIIHSKLFDFEVETNPDDWKALSAELSGGKTVRLIPYRKIISIASAAAVFALLTIGGWYLFLNQNEANNTQATVETTASPIEKQVLEDRVENTDPLEIQVDDLLAVAAEPVRQAVTDRFAIREEPPVQVRQFPDDEDVQEQEEEVGADQEEETAVKSLPVINDTDDKQIIRTEGVTTEKPDLAVVSTEIKRRRWGFGVGGGGYGLGSTTGGNAISSSSRVLNGDDYKQGLEEVSLRRAGQSTPLLDPVEGFNDENLLGKIKHLMPLSGGLGVSYYLTDRWTLQSGVVYTLLRSKGSYYEVDGISNWKRNLHFIGIPLSASYKIGDWKRIRFYVTAGGMGELNVAGQLKKTIQVENLPTIIYENVRMEEPLWSVHTRAGADYPLWKFVHLYAEGGFSYYFDNKSTIKTIRSDKPFNVSLQAGFRLGF
jgi:hypothetical protein